MKLGLAKINVGTQAVNNILELDLYLLECSLTMSWWFAHANAGSDCATRQLASLRAIFAACTVKACDNPAGLVKYCSWARRV